ncbi:Fatty acyl-CoA reductase 1 [Halotydeus destructor]|nr:Fatty acyl-CoA reductase 1 [Halotydeus destructor]
MSHLVSFVYVSTLNASYTEGFLEEEVYPLKSYFYKLDADAFWTKIKDMDARYVEKIKPTFLGKHRNTYSFSMALSENLVWDKKASLKHAAIVRPSCLSAGHSSPDHGWFDNIQLPTSLMTVHSMGLVRAVNEDANKILPIVPGDMLANGLINIGWYIANKTSSNCLVYNFSSDESNGVSVGQIQRFASDNFYKFPSLKAIREPVEPKPQNVLMYKMNRIVSEIMFAYFFDFLLICTGRSPMLVDMMKKMHQSMTEISAYYFRDSHKFSVINLKRLADSLSDEDKIMFNCDLSQISWPEHFADCYMRFRRNVLKETDDNVSDAIKRVYQ